MKALWATAGVISLAFGFIGIVLPLLPTVPFVLLAAFCFARSSERLNEWLLDHQVFGPLIEDWRRSGAIQPKAKLAATVSILAVFSISLALGLSPRLLLIQGVVLGLVLLFIWTRPTA